MSNFTNTTFTDGKHAQMPQRSAIRTFIHAYSLRNCTLGTLFRRLGMYLTAILRFAFHCFLFVVILTDKNSVRVSTLIATMVFGGIISLLVVWAMGMMEGAQGTRRVLKVGISEKFFKFFMSFSGIFHVVTFVLVFVAMSLISLRDSAFSMAVAIIWWILAVIMVALAIIVVLVKPENERYAEV